MSRNFPATNPIGTSISIFSRCVGVATLASLLLVLHAGCQAPGGPFGGYHGANANRRHHGNAPRIQRVVCLYDQKPWLNLDKAGDRDPEGIRFRIFLDGGKSKGVLADGTFDIEMYRLDRKKDGNVDRFLASEWEYPTSKVNTIAKPGMLGEGYFVYLRWADKNLAGSEVELVTEFRSLDGNVVRAATKRLRIPKYDA